ncbi:MAG: 1-(5-phosphoribosyl)-5-[(5-phosphoribosylamino) methylideneamino]imidazole-4-carboxamide isomerase [Bacteroidia bacterium]
MITVIPAIDIIDGKCVRLAEGDYARKTVYYENPVDAAKAFEDIGLKRLHMVDLDGAKAGKVINLKVLEAVTGQTSMVIDFGGGVKTEEDLMRVRNAGAAMVSIGSLAVKHPEVLDEWVMKYGSELFFIGADVRNNKVSVSGWLEQTNLDVFDFVKTLMSKGLTRIFCTDISKDGLLQGPSLALYQQLLQQNPGLLLTASGGVSSMNDIYQLNDTGCDSVIVGKAIYENRITLEELKNFQLNN